MGTDSPGPALDVWHGSPADRLHDVTLREAGGTFEALVP